MERPRFKLSDFTARLSQDEYLRERNFRLKPDEMFVDMDYKLRRITYRPDIFALEALTKVKGIRRSDDLYEMSIHMISPDGQPIAQGTQFVDIEGKVVLPENRNGERGYFLGAIGEMDSALDDWTKRLDQPKQLVMDELISAH